jgi:hypothetical protein
MIFTGVNDVRVPVLIPKRGKGHNEVMAHFRVHSTSKVAPIEFIRLLNACAGKTFVVSDTQTLAKNMVNELNLKNAVVTLDFSLMLDRVSPSYATVYFPLACSYVGSYARGGKSEEPSISVTIPVHIRDIYPTAGELVFTVFNPGHLLSEDLVDHVQKSTGVVLYPLSAKEEQVSLQQMLGAGLSAYEYLTRVQESSRDKKLGSGGKAEISIRDIYRMYGFNYAASWRNL